LASNDFAEGLVASPKLPLAEAAAAPGKVFEVFEAD